MDKISDFFKELKERVSNPFFFSFIISWLIINWKIVIGLLFYKIDDIKLDGYLSYIDLVSKNSNYVDTLCKPLGIALIYTFGFPFFRNVILRFSSWTKAWGSTWNLKAAKGSMVSISKYIELREVYEKRTKLLEEVLEKESKFLRENEDLKNDKLTLTKEKNDFYFELQNWKNVNNSSIIDGTWELKHLDENIPIEKIFIHSGTIRNDSSSAQFSIRNFYYHPSSTYISFFVREDIISTGTNSHKYHFYNLDAMDDFKLLKGRVNERFAVEFKKV